MQVFHLLELELIQAILNLTLSVQFLELLVLVMWWFENKNHLLKKEIFFIASCESMVVFGCTGSEKFFLKYYFHKVSYIYLVLENNTNQSSKSRCISCYKVGLLINTVPWNRVFCFQKELELKINDKNSMFHAEILQKFCWLLLDPASHFLFFSMLCIVKLFPLQEKKKTKPQPITLFLQQCFSFFL